MIGIGELLCGERFAAGTTARVYRSVTAALWRQRAFLFRVTATPDVAVQATSRNMRESGPRWRVAVRCPAAPCSFGGPRRAPAENRSRLSEQSPVAGALVFFPLA